MAAAKKKYPARPERGNQEYLQSMREFREILQWTTQSIRRHLDNPRFLEDNEATKKPRRKTDCT